MSKLEKQIGYSASEVVLMYENLRNALYYLEGLNQGRNSTSPFGVFGMEDLWHILNFLGDVEMALSKKKRSKT